MTNPLCDAPEQPFDIGGGALMPDGGILRSGAVPADTYWSEAQFAAEREAIYRRCWLFMAREEDLSAPGDYLVRNVEICGVSVLIVRGKDNALRAFHNVCRHRGAPVAAGECGRTQAFRCPYHSWTYRLDGSLTGIPDAESFPALDPDHLGLAPIALAAHAGFVFVNFAERPALSLADFLGGVAPLLEATTPATFERRDTLSLEIPANWKAGLDPQYEGYHVGTVHRATIKDMALSPSNPFGHFRKIAFAGPHVLGWSQGNPDWRPPARRPVHTHGMQVTGAVAARLGGKDYPTAQTPSSLGIFPNLMVHPGMGGWFLQQHWPLTPQSHRWEGRYYYQVPTSFSEHFAVTLSTLFARDSGMEDFLMMARQQQGLASGAAREFYYGEAEMMPRHRAAVIRAIVDAANGRKEHAA